MEYVKYIFEGFKLYDEVEDELYSLRRIDNRYVTGKYEDGILTIEADWDKKDLVAKIEISRNEIIQKVLDTKQTTKEIIYQLLKEKVAMAVREIER